MPEVAVTKRIGILMTNLEPSEELNSGSIPNKGVNRSDWFLRDGVHYHIHEGVIDFSCSALGDLARALKLYDMGESEFGLPHVFGEPPKLDDLNLAPIQPEAAKRDNVSHYTVGEIETIDFIADKFDGIEFCLANVVKYASRAKHKGQLKSDLEKIRNYATIALELYDKNGKTE